MEHDDVTPLYDMRALRGHLDCDAVDDSCDRQDRGRDDEDDEPYDWSTGQKRSAPEDAHDKDAFDGFVDAEDDDAFQKLSHNTEIENRERKLRMMQDKGLFDAQEQSEDNLFQSLINLHCSVFEDARKDRAFTGAQQFRFPSWRDTYNLESFLNRTPKGQSRMDALREQLDRFNDMEFKTDQVRRSNYQKMFHEAMINACALAIYPKEEMRLNRTKIMTDNGWSKIMQEVMISLYRRGGKTWAVAMFVAAYLVTQPHCTVLIFSPSMRQSRMLMTQVIDFVRRLMQPMPAKKYTHVCNADKFQMFVNDNRDDIRSVEAFPANSKTIRGAGGDVILIDEATFMDVSVFTSAIMPMLNKDKTALICLSTLTDTDNYYSQLLFMPDPDDNTKTFFNSFTIKRVCEECERNNRRMSCDHEPVPDWQSGRRHARIKKVMEQNFKAQYENEMLGMVQERKQRLFPIENISKLRASKWSAIQNYPRYVYMSVDPGGQGSASNSAIVSGFYDPENNYNIVGIENIAIKDIKAYKEIIRDHIYRLLSIPKFCNINHVVVIFENNMGSEVFWVEDLVNRLKAVKADFYTPQGDRTGVCTNEYIKEVFSLSMREQVISDKIRISDQVFSIERERMHGKVETSVTELIDQMENFQIHVQENFNNVFARPRKTFSGKSASTKDDLMMALLLGRGWSEKHRRDAAVALGTNKSYL